MLEGLPGGLEQQPLLRVHGERLARADAEEGGVELGRVVEEAALAYVAGARVIGVGIEELVQVPAAVGGQLRDGVPARRRPAPTAPRGSRTPPG